MTTDSHGNVIAAMNAGAAVRVMFAGHCDQIGFLVQYIDNEGFLYVNPIGGWDPHNLVGQRMTVWTSQGPVAGVIARKAIHLLTEEERKQAVKLKDLWVDIGAKDKAEAESLIRTGDPVTLALGYQEMRNNLANAPGMDDKVGLWVVMEAMRRLKGQRINCSLYSVSTVQEEIGLRGAQTSAYGIDPHVGIAVDVTHATDCPTVEKKQEGDKALGKGPVIYRGPNMNPARRRAADRCRQSPRAAVSARRKAGPRAPTPTPCSSTAQALQPGLVSIPNRYMHSAVEIVSLDDIDRAADLLAAFVADLKGDEDWTP